MIENAQSLIATRQVSAEFAWEIQRPTLMSQEDFARKWSGVIAIFAASAYPYCAFSDMRSKQVIVFEGSPDSDVINQREFGQFMEAHA